jgi:glycerophosphoryl diester phosphodiesterase
MLIAHRGVRCPRMENKIPGIRKASKCVGAVEVDVRLNSKGTLVLCHDLTLRDGRYNDSFKDLCKVPESMHIILDMKCHGGTEAMVLADMVSETIKDSHHIWELCSFDQRCVERLLDLDHGFPVGLISSGVTPYILDYPPLSFVSLEHDCVDEDDIKTIKGMGLRLYLWNAEKWRKYPAIVDGLIKNYVYSDLRLPSCLGKERDKYTHVDHGNEPCTLGSAP